MMAPVRTIHVLIVGTGEKCRRLFDDDEVRHEENTDISHDTQRGDGNRMRLFSKLKELTRQQRARVAYETVDWYMAPPSLEVLDQVRAKNKEVAAQIGFVGIDFVEHHHLAFQDFIARPCVNPYDFVWFFGCTNPHFVIDRSAVYIANFRRILGSDGIVLYSDGWPQSASNSCFKTDVYGFEACLDRIKSSLNDSDYQKARKHIKFLLSQFDEIMPGCYRFKHLAEQGQCRTSKTCDRSAVKGTDRRGLPPPKLRRMGL